MKTLSGLTPTTIYGFQVQALGVLGYSDWSVIERVIDSQAIENFGRISSFSRVPVPTRRKKSKFAEN